MSKEEKPSDDVPPENNRVEIKTIDEALGFFFRGLQKANRPFIEGKDAGRVGVIEALNVVIEFLSFFDGTIDHRQPLVSLINALVSLEEGNVLPLLKPHPRPGRRPALRCQGKRQGPGGRHSAPALPNRARHK
jgi:hypothetical protein